MALRIPKQLTDLHRVPTPDPGKLLGWSSSDGALGNFDIQTRFNGVCPNTMEVGTFVSIVGPGLANDVADLTDATRLPAVGCVVGLPSPGTDTVQTSGILVGLFTDLIAGRPVYLAPGGGIIQDLPVPTSGSGLWLQALGIALDSSMLLISPSPVLVRVYG